MKGSYENLTKERRVPIVVRGVYSNVVSDNTPITAKIDNTFERNGRTWRVSICAGTFVIGTAIDAQRDARGEVLRESDIIRVML